MSDLIKINIWSVMRHASLFRWVMSAQFEHYAKRGMQGRKPSQATAFDCICEVAANHKQELKKAINDG